MYTTRTSNVQAKGIMRIQQVVEASTDVLLLDKIISMLSDSNVEKELYLTLLLVTVIILTLAAEKSVEETVWMKIMGNTKIKIDLSVPVQHNRQYLLRHRLHQRQQHRQQLPV